MLAAAAFILAHADVQVSYAESGVCRVTEHVTVEGGEPVRETRVVSTFASRDVRVTDASGRSADGTVAVSFLPVKTTTAIAVDFEFEEPRTAFGYTLDYRVARSNGASFECPLAVPHLSPKGSRAVALSVEIPPGQVARGPFFPNLYRSGDRLVAELGALPAFVSAPWGASRLGAGFATHGVDAFAVFFIVAATLLWYKTREA